HATLPPSPYTTLFRSQTVRRGPAQEFGAERHADDSADQERRKPDRTDGVPQFPDRPALDDQAEGRDENGGLCRRRYGCTIANAKDRKSTRLNSSHVAI